MEVIMSGSCCKYTLPRVSAAFSFQQARSGDQLAALGGYTRDDEVAWHDTKASDSESADSVR
jgi:hypothetical protein